MSDPFIHILIRVSAGRELATKRCIDSILKQNYLLMNWFISYDAPECQNYFPSYGFAVFCEKDASLGPFFYNDYCNKLKAEIENPDSWFFFLDCDDYLANENVIEALSKHMTDDVDAIVCQMSRDNGKVKPTDAQIDAGTIESGRIGLPCLILRSKHAQLAEIVPTENGDFEWIKAVTDKVKTKFVKQVVVHAPARSYGKPLEL